MNPIEALMETATPLQRKLLEGCKWVPETGCWDWVGTVTTGRSDPILHFDSKTYNAKKKMFEEFVGPLSGRDSLASDCGCMNPVHFVIKYNNSWDKNKVIKESKKYSSRGEFMKNGGRAYQLAILNGWEDECFSHMVAKIKPFGYWDKSKVTQEAIKYTRRGDFQKGSGSAYQSAKRNGWLDEFFPKKGA